MRSWTTALAVAGVLVSAGATRAQDVPAGNTLSIPQAIELAWRNNIGAVGQKSQLELAKASQLGARSTFLPTLSFSGGWTRNSPVDLLRLTQPDTVIVDTGGGPDTVITDQTSFLPVKDAYSFGLSLSQPIFNTRGSIFHSPRAARAQVDQRQSELRSKRLELAKETKRLCYDLLKTQLLVNVRTRAAKRSEEQLETSKARYELGSASMSDYLKSKVQLGNDSLELIRAENAVAISMATLNDHLGLAVDRNTQIDAQLEFEPFPLPSIEARNAAIDVHPDVASSAAALDVWQLTLAGRQIGRLPSVTGVASYNWDGRSFPGDFDDIKRADRASIGIRVNYTLFSGFTTASGLQEARVQTHQAEANLVQQKRTVALAIRTAALRVEEGRKLYLVSEQQVQSAQEDLNIAQEKYNLGAATILDILNAQVSLSEAETGKIQAVFDYNLAVADLEKAMGGGD